MYCCILGVSWWDSHSLLTLHATLFSFRRDCVLGWNPIKLNENLHHCWIKLKAQILLDYFIEVKWSSSSSSFNLKNKRSEVDIHHPTRPREAFSSLFQFNDEFNNGRHMQPPLPCLCFILVNLRVDMDAIYFINYVCDWNMMPGGRPLYLLIVLLQKYIK